MGRMFHFISKSWSPVKGCFYNCYGGRCWARVMARRLQGIGIKKYADGFRPRLWEPDLKNPPRGELVFVVSMGDLFGGWIPDEWIMAVLEACGRGGAKFWFFETKNPLRMYNFIDFIPDNSVLSTTIETNRDYKLSKAPSILERGRMFLTLP